ncbi:hypothetical protein QBC34DRAFT_408122 [Podospora aff. communis PSN243]|uniref:Major facilitator superfamily (MFS) profile domain-containing protein n=1 Tax=Podospora aff. communis PSN243 TaxID=3040156 RepID=A0AAV9GJL8_9PEZI|nr:hypothetical protein QBC34DRAFT_408122 [Podospora aff. communis PSN243]
MASPSTKAPLSIPGGRRSRRRNHEAIGDDVVGDDYDEGEAIDANEFDLMLSRSLPTNAPLLEPESFEHSMLRNTLRRTSRNRSHDGRRQCSRGGSVASRHALRRPSLTKEDPMPSSEETPLLPSSSSVTSTSSNYAPLNTPYLSGVSPGRFWALFLSCILAFFVACFDSTIMASSHPVITSYFGSSNSASWLSTSFLLTSTAFQPLLGGLSDAVGRKVPYLVTLSIFFVATLWCTLAGSMTSFILARALCGLGAGGMMALSSIIISDLVPIEIRGPFQSYMNITYGAGAMLGAALGGVMADYLGWRWEFGVQLPLILASIVMAGITIPSDLGLYGKEHQGAWESMKKFDYAGSFLMSTSITFLILGLTLGGNILPWSHPFVLASLAIFSVFFPLFLYVESRAVKPIMPIHLVCHSPHMNLIFSNHIASFLANATLFNVPLFFQAVLLTTATTSGLRLITCSLVTSITGTATGFLISRTRRLKFPLVIGSTLVMFGMLSLSSMQRGWPTFFYVLCLALPSAGQGFQFPGTFMAILAVADQSSQAVVTSTLILWRSVGSVLGVACSSLVVQNALWYYLEKFVEGPEKEAVIERVRQSVEAVRELEGAYQEQVVQSYESAIRLTFLCCAMLGVMSVCLVAPVKLPRLGERK